LQLKKDLLWHLFEGIFTIGVKYAFGTIDRPWIIIHAL